MKRAEAAELTVAQCNQLRRVNPTSLATQHEITFFTHCHNAHSITLAPSIVV